MVFRDNEYDSRALHDSGLSRNLNDLCWRGWLVKCECEYILYPVKACW